MIIKRFTALIALASCAALAQDPQQPGDGNVPAPDLFDSQIVCTSQLPGASDLKTPTVVAMGAMESALDRAIGMGDSRIVGEPLLDDLGYTVPARGGNCGMGTGAPFTAPFTAANQGAVAADVAAGYTALLPKFTAVYGEPGNVSSTGTAGVLERAREALAQADDTTTSFRLDQLRDALKDAQEAHDEARAEFDAIAQGPIYGAAVAEWMAKAAVTRSIADYNAAVDGALGARSTLDAMNYPDYVALGNSELVGTVVFVTGGMGIVNFAELHGYTNSNLNDPQVATVDDDGVTNSDDSNFDAAGRLVVPMRLVGGTLQAVTGNTSVQNARERRDNYRIAADALNELKRENLNIVLQPVIDEAARRATAEADYYEQQYRSLLADTTNRNPVTVDNPSTPQNEAAPYSIASRHADYIGASNKRATAEAGLRAAAAAREAATRNVIDTFQNPASFYAQLVARRQALKAEADRRVAAVTNPSTALTDAAEAAAKALTEAEKALDAYHGLVGGPGDSGNPVAGLVDTLLETDGDDGQAVVDAISQTWDGTVENKDAIGALTADTVDGDESDGPVTANRKAIDALTADTDDGDEQDGPITANRKANAGNIAANAGNIAANAGNIASNASNIAVNAAGIVDNRGLISQNAATLVEHGAFIERNAGNIALNSERIGANAAAIGMNSGLIADNRHLIGELSGDLDIVRAGVAASIALSRMPSVDGGGISFGAGTFAGEMAYAVGFQVERGFGTFDVGLTSSGGEIGAGVGVGLKVWH